MRMDANVVALPYGGMGFLPTLFAISFLFFFVSGLVRLGRGFGFAMVGCGGGGVRA